jgi:hypothetical protein
MKKSYLALIVVLILTPVLVVMESNQSFDTKGHLSIQPSCDILMEISEMNCTEIITFIDDSSVDVL